MELKGTAHNLKLEIAFCTAVYHGNKNFEVRKNDRGFQKGDTIRFIPVENGLVTTHPIEQKRYEITYVLNGWGIENGYVVFGIKELEE